MTRPGSIKAEAFDVMQYYYNRAQEPLVRCLVRLVGHVDEAALRRAVEQSAKALPILFCRFDVSKRQPRWVPAGYSALNAVCVVDADGKGPGFAASLLASASIDICGEPLIKIVIVRRKESDELCIVMSHLACDGGGFKEYLYLLCELYSKCRNDSGYCAELMPSPRGLKELASGFTLAQKRLILSQHKEISKAYTIPVVSLRWDPGSPFITEHAIAAERFEGIRARAKALHATVNDLLLTAYLRVLCNETRERALALPCPVDLRKYLPGGGMQLCNLTANLMCRAEIAPGETFAETARKVSEAMAREKESTACLIGPLRLRYIYPFISFKAFGKNFDKLFRIPVTSFTNLGVIDSTRFRLEGAAVSGVYLTGAIKRKPYFQVAASTFGGCCTLTCNMNGTTEDREFSESFLERIDREMAGEEMPV